MFSGQTTVGGLKSFRGEIFGFREGWDRTALIFGGGDKTTRHLCETNITVVAQRDIVCPPGQTQHKTPRDGFHLAKDDVSLAIERPCGTPLRSSDYEIAEAVAVHVEPPGHREPSSIYTV